MSYFKEIGGDRESSLKFNEAHRIAAIAFCFRAGLYLKVCASSGANTGGFPSEREQPLFIESVIQDKRIRWKATITMCLGQTSLIHGVRFFWG